MKAQNGGVLNGFLDRGARFEGTLTFEDVFRIDGFFKGTIISDHERPTPPVGSNACFGVVIGADSG